MRLALNAPRPEHLTPLTLLISAHCRRISSNF